MREGEAESLPRLGEELSAPGSVLMEKGGELGRKR